MPQSSAAPVTHQLVRWDKDQPPTEEEAEAKLHREGYDSFRWHDVPGSTYPRHRHDRDECVWVLSGQITFTVNGEPTNLGPGDRLYLPAGTPHTASVPCSGAVTYLVGQRRA